MVKKKRGESRRRGVVVRGEVVKRRRGLGRQKVSGCNKAVSSCEYNVSRTRFAPLENSLEFGPISSHVVRFILIILDLPEFILSSVPDFDS